MSLLDVILNIVGLLLWINWRAAHVKPMPAPGKSLTSTLRPAGPPTRRWTYLVILVGLLAGRGLLYWQIGPPIDWVPRMSLGPTTLSFSSAYPARIFLFSALSFVATLAAFYFGLLLLSAAMSRVGDNDAGRRLLRAHLGAVDRWPAWIKLALPLVIAGAAWCAVHPLLNSVGMAPAAASAWRLAGQGAVIGLSTYLTAKFLLIALFALHLFNSYVYLGEYSFWKLVSGSSRELLRPFEWLPLRAGKIDFAPVAAIVLVIVGASYGQPALTGLYEKLL